ncbi:AHS2-domain-containing protein [Exidia glandulosa HHB12029]|uniref:AHS2-domain-containing protein n=1 Tax=Exidia glandulosa HHB12029 TaxID=1314781 RepID=A0A165BVE5_EXIGL|nr:AHS2-domain-containing protein [Exidia glandulosa HHB12029]
MNTRLQVEHGVTELCYNVDLVELMLRQADAERGGRGGMNAHELQSLCTAEPNGVAIEARVYAENPAKDFAPCPGLLQLVQWHDIPGSRIDTWVFSGSRVTPNYDPLIAKLMVHASTRTAALEGLQEVLSNSKICGPPTNMAFLAAVTSSPAIKAGNTLTSFVQSFAFAPHAIEVVSGGAYTLVQDLPARPAVGKGIPHAGPMDLLTFQLANILAGNARGAAGLEITLTGPELRFLGPAVVALCGPTVDATLDGAPFPTWSRQYVRAGQSLKIGKLGGGGCRAYLAIYGGLPSVADYFGSKSTSPSVGIGGYQGRQLAPGDQLEVVAPLPDALVGSASMGNVELPERLRPMYTTDWKIKAMVGPHDEGYLLPEDIDMIYSTSWKVSHNASRSGIRLVGPVPRWARKDGGEGGSHPSNLVEYGYPIGALNWTGDDPCIFPVDCPNFGGFVSSTTIVRADWWKMGQLKAGDRMQYERVSLEDALEARARLEMFLQSVEGAVSSAAGFDGVQPLDTHSRAPSTLLQTWGDAVVGRRSERDQQPEVTYRQGGDDHLIVEYGRETFDLNHRCRVTALESHIRSSKTPSWIADHLTTTMGCCTSLLLFYDGSQLSRARLLEYLLSLEDQLGDLTGMTLTCRRFKLPMTFQSTALRDAIQRYMDTQRPHAPYLPDNLSFVARNNSISTEQLKEILLTGTFVAVVVGFYCGNTVCLPSDPRHRLNCPKMNPSRVYTPEGTVSWGGSCMSLYPVDSPGGYMCLSRTVPCFDTLGWKPGFAATRPWLYRDFDLLTYYEVSEDEMDDMLRMYKAGRYVWEWEEVAFDMAEHNRLLAETVDEVQTLRSKQAIAQEEMTRAETESLARWREEKLRLRVDESTIEDLVNDPSIIAVEAPVDANVWKVEVVEGALLKPAQLIVILEAMKLEIAVRLPDDVVPTASSLVKVDKLLVRPGETVKAGGKIALLRKMSIED